MSADTVKLLEDALKLPAGERADLASCLYASLEQESDLPLHPSWEAEIKRRIRDVDSGKAVLIPLEEARKRIFGNE